MGTLSPGVRAVATDSAASLSSRWPRHGPRGSTVAGGERRELRQKSERGEAESRKCPEPYLSSHGSRYARDSAESSAPLVRVCTACLPTVALPRRESRGARARLLVLRPASGQPS
eukprot:1391127-Prymnesium_polylepis.2